MTDNPGEFTVNIADIVVKLIYPPGMVSKAFLERYDAFQASQLPQFTVTIQYGEVERPQSGIILAGDQPRREIRITAPDWRGEVDWGERAGWFVAPPTAGQAAFEMIGRVFTACLAFQSGGFMLHGAGILYQDAAYCFIGPSGSGKTTIARLSPGCQVLNDDLVLCIPSDHTWYIHSTPFSNPTQTLPVPGKGRLKAIYTLRKSQETKVEQRKPAYGLAELLANIPVMTGHPQIAQELANRCLKLITIIPVLELKFHRKSSIWNIIR